MEAIALEKIVSESNRKYTKEDGFEQMVNSIAQVGILEPPIVRRLDGGQYRVIAGRRRVAAARKLDFEKIDCIVKEPDDTVKDEIIALLENVNRLEMHPLDEAESFSRMAAAGHTVENIAGYYARSPSAIYKRIRLAALTENLKTMFRDGLLNISGAAALAELPEEDQEEFFRSHELTREHSGGEPDELDISVITSFIYKKQKMRLRPCMGDGCAGCAKRTHNQGNSLFEEYAHMDDVCLDGDCYRQKWREVIGRALAEKAAECGGKTDLKVRFHSVFSDGIPDQLYKKATHIEVDLGDGEQTRFEVLRDKNWNFIGETKRKNGACYEIGETMDRDGCGLRVLRVGYEERAPEERAAGGAGEGKNSTVPLNSQLLGNFGAKNAAAFAAERGMKPAELEGKIDKAKKTYQFTVDIKEKVIKRITAERVKDKTPLDYFSMYLKLYDIEFDGLSDDDKKLFRELTGRESVADIKISGEMQRLFHFLLVCGDGYNETLQDIMPTLGDVAGGKLSASEEVFMKYAGMDGDGYRALWMECAGETLDGYLKPKEKTAKKKGKQKKGPAAGGASDGEDYNPFDPLDSLEEKETAGAEDAE